VLAEDGRKCAVGEIGEIYSRGIFVGYEGYYKRPPTPEDGFRADGWFSAGDMAILDDEGFVYLVDRKKDLIISGGENIYPTEVEAVLTEHEAIAEAAVVGVPDLVWGDRVCAVVRLRPGAALTGDELIDWARGRLADYKRPRRVLFWNDIPRNPTGKILRRTIRERIAALPSA
jgi:acyl-CoA synthetase (AMP-forming)/AMP-acid ligase II